MYKKARSKTHWHTSADLSCLPDTASLMQLSVCVCVALFPLWIAWTLKSTKGVIVLVWTPRTGGFCGWCTLTAQFGRKTNHQSIILTESHCYSGALTRNPTAGRELVFLRHKGCASRRKPQLWARLSNLWLLKAGSRLHEERWMHNDWPFMVLGWSYFRVGYRILLVKWSILWFWGILRC